MFLFPFKIICTNNLLIIKAYNIGVYDLNQLITHKVYLWGFITIIFVVIIFFSFKNTLLKQFISLECKYNKLQFGVRVSSIEVSKQKRSSLHRAMSTTKFREGNHPGATPFTSEAGFRGFSIKHWCLCSLSQKSLQ